MAGFSLILLTGLNSHLSPLLWGISILDPMAHLMFLFLAELRWGGGEDITFTFPLRGHLAGCRQSEVMTSPLFAAERGGSCIPRLLTAKEYFAISSDDF